MRSQQQPRAGNGGRMAVLTVSVAALSAVAALSTTAWACLQDRDSLETEARGVPDVIAAISGRFARNPPLFYQMRLQRVQQQLASTPTRLDWYDDAAVACDRLGRDDEAIHWIEGKRTQLQKLDLSEPKVRDHWYRYYANCGTFWVHRWIAKGADRRRLSEMKHARDLIRRAIHINPGAHFGREKYQLKAMEWIIAPPKSKDNAYTLPDFLGLSREESGPLLESDLQKRGLGDAVRGLTGLITLGNAWQSIDVYNALRHTQRFGDKNSIIALINFRLEELARSGKRSLYPPTPGGNALLDFLDGDPMSTPNIANTEELRPIYTNLRREADRWQARRSAYMMARLQAGRHPDTDATFWSQWHDDGPPSLHLPRRPGEIWVDMMNNGSMFVIIGALILSLALLRRKRRANATQTA